MSSKSFYYPNFVNMFCKLAVILSFPFIRKKTIKNPILASGTSPYSTNNYPCKI